VDPASDRRRAEPRGAEEDLRVPILASKILPDQPPAHTVVRPRLEAVLDTDRQVVVVCAPAGYGKSGLVASWVSRRPDLRVAWTSLDALDRNPVVFWRHLIAAITRVVPAAAEADEILIERGPDSGEHLSALANALLVDGRPLVLVLDDLHMVDGPATREDLAFLVDRCRSVLRLVTLGRSDPALPLGRWRAEGRVVEIRDRDLAFRDDETGELLSPFRLEGLDARDLARLNDRAEGWAAGLLLSALALEGSPDMATHLEEVLHSDRYLIDYLAEEVLERLDPDLRQFALELSVLPFFDAELAQRVTGRANAAGLFHDLLQRNPFVVVTASAPSHRFHNLIRSLLLAELGWRDPTRVTALRRAAAEALLERGMIDAGVDLLLAAGDTARAFDVVVRPVLALNDSGRLRDFVRWFELLPQVHPSDAGQALDYSLALTMAGRSGEAVRWAERAAELADGADEGFPVVYAVTSMVALAAGGRCRDAARHLAAVERLGADVRDSPRVDSRVSGQVTRIALALGDLDRAERWLHLVERHAEPAITRVHAPALRSWLLLERGDASGAREAADAATVAAADLRLRPHPATFDADAAAAAAALASLRMDDAAVALERIAGDADVFDWPWFLLRSWPLLVEQRALQEGWPAALELIDSWSGSVPAGADDLVARRDQLRARALLGCGRHDDAIAIVGRLPRGTLRSLLEARAAVTTGRFEDAEAALGPAIGWEVPARLEALLLLVQAQASRPAEHTARVALELAAKGGLLSAFALEGRPVDRVLQALPVEVLHPELAAWRRGAAGEPARAATRSRIVEPLTAKELEVLVHLPSHLTYQGIGTRLYVSVNTVKTYVSAIYRKLGVSSRSEAVAVARSAGLLP
jgi:LuxR family transcriptional regulator, maltose regulon positive regulatory protein